MTTTLEFALVRLSERNLKQTTVQNYIATLKQLGIVNMPVEECTRAFLFNRLQMVLNVNTRNKHAIALRTALGISLPLVKVPKKPYVLPDIDLIKRCFATSQYRPYAFSMLFAGMRLGESLVKQRIEGNIIYIDRQINGLRELSSAKTSGPVYVPDWFAQEYREFEPTKGYSTVPYGIRQAGRALNLNLNPHLLRKKFATELANHGVPPEILKNQMRHSNLSTTLEFYTQHSESDYKQFVAKSFG